MYRGVASLTGAYHLINSDTLVIYSCSPSVIGMYHTPLQVSHAHLIPSFRLGLLNAEHAANVLDVVAARASLLDSDGDLVTSPAIMEGHWRGRMGLDKEEQLRHSFQS